MTERPRPRVAGILLAGGRSRRFGGDKRYLVVDGEPLFVRPLRAMAEVADEIAIVIGPDEPELALPDGLGKPVRFARDRLAFAGPLAAVGAGVDAVPDAELVLVAGADMPSLEPAVLRALLDEVGAGSADACTLEGPDAAHLAPLPFAGRRALIADVARDRLATGERSLHAALLAIGARQLPGPAWRALDPDGRSLRDVDRPEDVGA